MKTYRNRTKMIAAATPPERNRIVDFWRALAILIVVFGHWLAASIWLQPDGEVMLLNSLEWVPHAQWITWVVQVMPIFFLAGGYANARGLARVHSGELPKRAWITGRVRRLFTPVVPLLLVWVGLVLTMRTVVSSDVVYAGAMSATVPLWFLAVYLVLTAVAPFTHRWWQRNGFASVATLTATAIGVDVARFVLDVPGVGWLNFLFVWAAIHQLGYWWSTADENRSPGIRSGWALLAGSLGLLVTLTTAGPYPVAMVGIPGGGVTNMTPPTFAMLLLGIAQLGFIRTTAGIVSRFTATARGWHAVVAVSGSIMTIYLWHLSAMSLLGAIGLSTFDGVLFRIEPGTLGWWLTRPLWLAALALVTLGLAGIFARYEWRISKRPTPQTPTVVALGLVLIAASTVAVALIGIAARDATVRWIIPLTAVAGAATLGAVPARRARTNGQLAPDRRT